MRKFIIPAVVLAAASAALPAAAQSYGHHGRPPVYQAGYGHWQSINARQDNLDRRIDRGVRTGRYGGQGCPGGR